MKFSQLKLTSPYLQLPELFYEKVDPTPLKNPFLISVSEDAAKLLGVDEDLLEDTLLVDIVNGEKKLEGSQTFSMNYAGHQFSDFTAALGDGRVINLGKVNGENLQLKGAGLTPYSRLGDGRATIGSSIREYLMSEAMHGLGIETSRALALIGSGTNVVRKELEKGAIVLRLSPTWVRFGTFEHFNAYREHKMVKDLADYVIEESFSYIIAEEEPYVKMYTEIVKNTATTMAAWQSVGFTHGVMNTDNMSIDGRTIDYGPFSFLNDYDSSYVCNKTDKEGRYSFKSQPGAARWNLEKLAIALSPILDNESALEILDEVFYDVYKSEHLRRMSARLGLYESVGEDKSLIQSMHRALSDARVDYNLFFRKLSRYDGDKKPILDICVSSSPLEEWLDVYDKRLLKEKLSQEKREQKMLAVNPKYILKNHILDEAIEKAKVGNFTMVDDLLKVAHSPYEENENLEYLCAVIPLGSKNLQLCCSS